MAVNIVFEGIESAGKTLMKNLLSEVLLETTPFTVATVGEPGGTELGKMIRHTLLTGEHAEHMHPRTRVLLYNADRNEMIENKIVPFNRDNPLGITVGDRSWASTIALQTVDGAEEEYINHVIAPFVAKYPTKYFLLDIHEDEAKVRLKAAEMMGREMNWRDRQPAEVYRLQRMNYLKLAKKYPDKFILIDAFKSPWELVYETRRLVLTELANNTPEARELALMSRDRFEFSDLQKIAHRYSEEKRFNVEDMLFAVLKARSEIGGPNQSELMEKMYADWRDMGLTETTGGRERRN